MKLITVVGARPQFVKAAVLSRVLKRYPPAEEVVIHTGQHFDDNMSAMFFRDTEIPEPDYNLGVNNLSHAAMTGKMLLEIEKILLSETPEIVVLYGDTNSTLAGALAAAKLHIPLAHVEAGLRSFNLLMPEEINRVLTDKLSQLLFVPSKTAVKNLRCEGITTPNVQIFKVGDIMHDAFLYYKKKAVKPTGLSLPSKFILLTLHRRENLEKPKALEEFFYFMDSIHKGIHVVFPCHPATREKLESHEIKTDIQLIDSVGYFEMLYLLQHCSVVMTDSGGLQKEAFYMEKYCITLRDETEWVELVDLKANQLCGLNPEKILKALNSFLSKSFDIYVKPYGMGNTGELVTEAIVNYLS